MFGTCLVFHQLHASPARACGATGFMFSPLLPLEGATDVGVDAALIASTNGGPIAFELRRVNAAHVENAAAGDVPRDAGWGASDEDAGEANGQLSVTCKGPAYGGQLCVAKPSSPLAANTEYEWSAVVAAPDGLDPGSVHTGVWYKFTTSNMHGVPAPVDLRTEVLANNRYLDAPCGNEHFVRLEVSAEMAAQPLVVNVHDVSPSYVMEPKVLTSESLAVEVPLYNPPECVRLETFDVTGKRTELELLCPEEILPATYFDGAGQVVTPSPPSTDPTPSRAPTSEAPPSNDEVDDGDEGDHLEQRGIDDPSDGGCAVVVPASRSRSFSWWLVAAAGLGVRGWRRRRDRGSMRRK